LQEKGKRRSKAQSAHRSRVKAMGQHPTREELAELLLDEAGQPMSVAPVGGFLQEGLQMFADDGVEDGVLAVAGLIRAMGMRHALG
jgi:hypothetical protein